MTHVVQDMIALGIKMKLKLIHKLLIAMFASTALVLVLISLVSRASIGRGFMDFLQQQEHGRVEQLVPELADWYSDHGSWDELANDPRQFYELVFTVLLQASDGRLESISGGPPRDGRRNPRFSGPGAGRQRPGQPGPGGGPGPGGRNSLPQRIFLLDADKTPVTGEIPLDIDEDILMPITVAGNEVGWLGVAVIRSFKLPEEEAFITRLRNDLIIGLVTGLVVAALLAWLLARHLSRPVNRVAEGIRSLAAGDFNTRLETKGSDEIAKLGDDVNRLSATLSEHENTRKRVMSDMAHELRTPLAIISGELEAMSDGIRPLNKQQLDSVREEIKHLSVLVDDLHSLTLTDAGALAYKMKGVVFNDLVQLAADSFKGPAAKKNLELSFSNPEHVINLQGDEQRLRQLLHNLLDNAVRYTDPGGRISMTLGKDRQQALLTISDTAPGASAEECERMFERLYRMEASRNRNSGGSGLGLAICRNIVEAHGGKITAKPGPHGGLMISASLPLDL
jgi:two-component system sensor histidine kinase BaeS